MTRALPPIEDDEEHGRLLAIVESLMDADPARGTVEGELLNLLATVIEDYEKMRFPFRSEPLP